MQFTLFTNYKMSLVCITNKFAQAYIILNKLKCTVHAIRGIYVCSKKFNTMCKNNLDTVNITVLSFCWLGRYLAKTFTNQNGDRFDENGNKTKTATELYSSQSLSICTAKVLICIYIFGLLFVIIAILK